MKALWSLVFAVNLLAIGHDAVAVCVLHNNTAALQQALAGAAAGTDTTIRVEQGTYAVGAWLYHLPPSRDISLLGGYKPGTSCDETQRHITASPNTAATNTILDGQAASSAYITFAEPSNPNSFAYGRLTIEGFEIRHLHVSPGADPDETLDVQWSHGAVRFRYNWVHANTAITRALRIATGGEFELTNNLIDHNTADTAITAGCDPNACAPYRIANNTISDNAATGLALLKGDASVAQMLNNILFANPTVDLDLTNVQVESRGDTFKTSALNGSAAFAYFPPTRFAGDPGYDANYHLTAGSSSINSGAQFGAFLPTQDLDGNPRWIGSHPDRGVFESNTQDQYTYVVTSTADTSGNCAPASLTCTLRQAITDANTHGASQIRFNIAGGCGATILIGSPLPTVKVPLRIVGSSQPGSVRNATALDTPGALTTKICLVLESPVANTQSNAIVVGSADVNAELEIEGVEFERFSSAAVDLLRGYYSWIHGNSFGVKTYNPFIFGNGEAIALYNNGSNSAAFTTIGGPAARDANLFGTTKLASGGAVVLNTPTSGSVGSVVMNNFFGVGIDRSTTFPNAGSGIIVLDSDFNEISGNSIVASAHDGILLNASNSNWVHDNTVGRVSNTGYGYYDPFKNGGAGVDLVSGASGNRIGVFDAALRQAAPTNEILNNGGPGVWLQTGAGAGNSVLENDIGLNGALAIDLGPTGAAYGNSGVPNDGQAAPYMQKSYRLGEYELLLNFSLSGSDGAHYRVDFYYGAFSCDASGYGPAYAPSVTYDLTLSGIVQNFRVQLPLAKYNNGSYLAATATNTATGDTSQISNCVPDSDDRIFADGFDG